MTYSLITKSQLTPLGKNQRLKPCCTPIYVKRCENVSNFYIVKELIV